jgi:hypothetical protein
MKKIKSFLLIAGILLLSAPSFCLTVNVSTEKELQDAINKHFGVKDIVSEIKLTKDIGLTKEIVIPVSNTRQNYKGLIIDLSGNTVFDNSVNGLPYLLGRVPKDQAEAVMATSWSLTLKNGCLKGKRFNNKTLTGSLLILGSTYNSTVENIQLNGAAVSGIEYRFCLMGRIQNILVNSVEGTAIYVGKGNWPGAGNNTSQSNGTIIEQVRVFNTLNGTAFNIQSSSLIHIKNCISEGNNAKYHLLWEDFETTTTVQDGTVENFYIESEGTIKMSIRGGSRVLRNIWMQYKVTFELEALAGPTTVFFENIPYWPVGSNFKLIGSNANLAARFTDVAVDARNPILWGTSVNFPIQVGDVIGMPRYMTYISSLNNKWASTNTLRINGITTFPSAPTSVTAKAPILINGTSCTMEGKTGDNDGGGYITHRGFIIKKVATITGGPGSIHTNDGVTFEGSGEGVFKSTIENLSPNTLYAIRAFAYSENGAGYSETFYFKTLN